MGADIRTVELQLPSRLGYERIAMDAAGAAARLMGFHPSRVDDLKTAVAEACINAMEHGHQFNAATKVVVLLTIGDSSLQIDVADRGKGIPGKIESPDIAKKFAGKQSPRGWGVFLIKSLMDEVQFNVRSEMGNVTRMIVRLEPEPPEGNTQTFSEDRSRWPG